MLYRRNLYSYQVHGSFEYLYQQNRWIKVSRIRINFEIMEKMMSYVSEEIVICQLYKSYRKLSCCVFTHRIT